MGKRVRKNRSFVKAATARRTDAKEFERVAARVSGVSIAGNLVLSVFKLLAGVLAHSGAMVSDAVHSASDVFSSIIVIIGVKLSARASDEDHPYGHERLECVAAILLAAILLLTGIGIGKNALQLIAGGEYADLEQPGLLALAAAVVSIAAKELMFWYTKIHADRIDSNALLADAWHHRSDSLSSVGALIGILGARLGLRVLDPVASLVICFFIARAAYDIFRDAVDKMVDHACDEKTQQQLYDCALLQNGVVRIDLLQTRMFGSRIYVDIEIGADGDKTLWETHAIAECVHNAIEREFPKVKHIMVHVNPIEAPASDEAL